MIAGFGCLLRVAFVAALVVTPLRGWSEGGSPASAAPGSGLFVMPIKEGADSRIIKIFDLSGFEVRLAVDYDQNTELGYPCGEWFIPPPNRYKIWIDGPDLMSPFQSVMALQGTGELPQKELDINVVPAGRVVLDAAHIDCPSCNLRLIHLNSHLIGGFARNELTRRASLDRAAGGVLMPAGDIVAALFDNTRQEYVALSKPLHVPAGGRVVWTPDPDPESRHLVAILERPTMITLPSEDDVNPILLTRDGARVTPDFLVRATGRLVAIWYDLDLVQADLTIESETLFMPPDSIRLARPGIRRVESALSTRPSLTVEYELPHSIEPEQLIITQRSNRSTLRTVALGESQDIVVVKDLPPCQLLVELDCKGWTFVESADLSRGLDEAVLIAPQGFKVDGRLLLGEHGHKGRITFSTGRERSVEVQTNEVGEYEVDLFKQQQYQVSADLDGIERASLRRVWKLTKDTHLDIRIPDNQIKARVIDAETREGISEAQLVADNIWLENGREMPSSYILHTDADGIILLPPMNPGTLRLHASAKGYLDSDRKDVQVSNSEERTIEIALDPVSSAQEVKVLLPSGAPADGVEAQLRTDLGTSALPYWTSSADAAGVIRIPDITTQSFLLIRHPAAASAIIPCFAPRCALQSTFSLAATAPPLMIRSMRVNGDTAQYAAVAVRAAAGWVSNRPLAWLYWSSYTVTGGDGIWIGQGFPQAPLRLAAWKGYADSELSAINSLASDVPFPWPSPVELTVINE